MRDFCQFIIENTSQLTSPHVPEISLHLADEIHSLWHKSEEELQSIGLEPPFWAFAWAGGQGLARYVLDNPEIVKGKSVLDLACGSALVAIAAAKTGSTRVVANDIDPVCRDASQLNAKLNGVALQFEGSDLLNQPPPNWLSDIDVILAGDVFYDQQFAKLAHQFLVRQANLGKTVLIGDPGRAYLPKEGLTMLAEYQVPVTRVLEDSEVKQTRVWKIKNQ